MQTHLACGRIDCTWRDEPCETWVESILSYLNYEWLDRTDKGIVRRFIQHVTGYSRATVARFIARHRQGV